MIKIFLNIFLIIFHNQLLLIATIVMEELNLTNQSFLNNY